VAKLSFTEHPHSVGETYWQHMGMALSFAGPLFLASLACLVHALLPFAFERTGSNAVTALYRRMVSHRVGGKAPLPGSAAAAPVAGAPAQNLP